MKNVHLRKQGTPASPNLSKLAKADMLKKTRYLCRHCLQNEWTLSSKFFVKNITVKKYLEGSGFYHPTNLDSKMNSIYQIRSKMLHSTKVIIFIIWHLKKYWFIMKEPWCRSVVPGCAGCARAHPDFGRSVNPISTRGDRLCPPNYYWHTRIFRPSDGPVV